MAYHLYKVGRTPTSFCRNCDDGVKETVYCYLVSVPVSPILGFAYSGGQHSQEIAWGSLFSSSFFSGGIRGIRLRSFGHPPLIITPSRLVDQVFETGQSSPWTQGLNMY